MKERIAKAKIEFRTFMEEIAQKTGLSVYTLVELGLFQVDGYFKKKDNENLSHQIAVVCRLLLMDIEYIAAKSGKTPLEIYEEHFSFWKK